MIKIINNFIDVAPKSTKTAPEPIFGPVQRKRAPVQNYLILHRIT